jgi:hypothetical protein
MQVLHAAASGQYGIALLYWPVPEEIVTARTLTAAACLCALLPTLAFAFSNN